MEEGFGVFERVKGLLVLAALIGGFALLGSRVDVAPPPVEGTYVGSPAAASLHGRGADPACAVRFDRFAVVGSGLHAQVLYGLDGTRGALPARITPLGDLRVDFAGPDAAYGGVAPGPSIVRIRTHREDPSRATVTPVDAPPGARFDALVVDEFIVIEAVAGRTSERPRASLAVLQLVSGAGFGGRDALVAHGRLALRQPGAHCAAADGLRGFRESAV